MDHPVILFDGVCEFCNGTVNFLIRQDKGSLFRFAPIQSEAGQALIKKYNLPSEPESFVYIEKNRAYLRTTAILMLARKLKWYWSWTQLFWIIPRFVRDAAYKIIAANRYRWFGKKEECMIPTQDVRNRFLL
jgi:predicted DCC family thiol-disulfide oxidoreductase YuxK